MNWAVGLALATELVGLIIGSVILGTWIDKQFTWPGYSTIALILLSLLSWLMRLNFWMKKWFKD